MTRDKAHEKAELLAQQSRQGAIAWQNGSQWYAHRVPEDMETYKANLLIQQGNATGFRRKEWK